MCKERHNVYWIYADTKHRQLMESGRFLDIPSNCPQCVSSPRSGFYVPKSITWERRLQPAEVKKNLEIHERETSIDFNQAEQYAKSEAKKKQDSENQAQRGEELLQWAKKKV